MKYYFGLLALLLAATSCSTSRRSISTSPKATALESKVIQKAKSFIGKPYKFGGEGPKSFDCSGFTSYVYRACGKTIPRTTSEQAKFGKSIQQNELKAGDLIFFKKDRGGNKINHVAIVQRVALGVIQVIHSTSSRGVLSENVLQSSYWKQRILFFRRVS